MEKKKPHVLNLIIAVCKSLLFVSTNGDWIERVQLKRQMVRAKVLSTFRELHWLLEGSSINATQTHWLRSPHPQSRATLNFELATCVESDHCCLQVTDCFFYLISDTTRGCLKGDQWRGQTKDTFNELHWKLFDIMCDQCWGQLVASRAATPMYLLCLVVAWKSMRSGLFPFRAEPQLQRSFQGESDLTKEKSLYAFQKIFSILSSNKSARQTS